MSSALTRPKLEAMRAGELLSETGYSFDASAKLLALELDIPEKRARTRLRRAMLLPECEAHMRATAEVALAENLSHGEVYRALKKEIESEDPKQRQWAIKEALRLLAEREQIYREMAAEQRRLEVGAGQEASVEIKVNRGAATQNLHMLPNHVLQEMRERGLDAPERRAEDGEQLEAGDGGGPGGSDSGQPLEAADPDGDNPFPS